MGSRSEFGREGGGKEKSWREGDREGDGHRHRAYMESTVELVSHCIDDFGSVDGVGDGGVSGRSVINSRQYREGPFSQKSIMIHVEFSLKKYTGGFHQVHYFYNLDSFFCP